ncbi:adenosine receptor A2b-like [Oculina patagonica]
MNNTSAPNSSDIHDDDYGFSFSDAFTFPVFTCYVIITAVAIIGNFIVCCTIMAKRNLRNNPTTLFLLSLTFSDLVTATVVAPLDIEVFFRHGVWLHGEKMCEIWSTVFATTVPTSIFTLLAVSVDRYKSLSDPLNRFRRTRFMTRKKALVVNFLIWVYSILFASIPLMGWRNYPGESVIYEDICWYPYKRAYTSLTCLLNSLLPLLITCGIYVKIYHIVRERNKSVAVAQCKCVKLTFTQETNSYLSNLKAAKTISMFVGVFFFCWVPYSTYIIIISLCKECKDMIPLEAYPFLLMLGYLNSALNPFLFAFRSKSFKNIYSKIISSVILKAQPKVKVRRGSTISQLTFTSEIPDAMDSGVWLRAIKRVEQQEFPGKIAVRDVSV